MAQARHGRRGDVFSVRLTDEQRRDLETLHTSEAGPRGLGPWLVWRALRDVTKLGSTSPAGYYPLERVVPDLAGGGTIRSSGAEVVPELAKRIILDLCAGSGAWSEPYGRAGYRVVRVTLPERDVRTFAPPAGDVWGILAAPPCDQFSLARNGQRSERDFVRGMSCVNACLRLVLHCRPKWWALENPVGLLSRWLGTPRDVFEPYEFGDPWTKRTALWGRFVLAERGPFVAPVGGGPLCTVCDPTRRKASWCSKPEHRAVTPAGFVRAFFTANP
jgi:hypothetical protein